LGSCSEKNFSYTPLKRGGRPFHPTGAELSYHGTFLSFPQEKKRSFLNYLLGTLLLYRERNLDLGGSSPLSTKKQKKKKAASFKKKSRKKGAWNKGE